jgi:predicted phosphodiesterase
MRVRVLSDVHLEFGPFDPPKVECDAVVLAGDIHVGTQAIDWIQRQFPKTPVVYVLGNHEFYRHAWPDLIEELRTRCAGTSIHVLENAAIDLCGFTFLGCTLWTDFALMGEGRKQEAWAEAAGRLTDYHRIRFSPEDRLLRSPDTARWHEASRRWLEQSLAEGDPQRTIVVTHHAPSGRAIPPFHAGELLNAAFASPLDEMVARSGVPLWVYGHTHYSDHFRIGGTHVVSNQRGYPREPDARFDPALVMDL